MGHPLTQEGQEKTHTATHEIQRLIISNPKALAMVNELVKELKSSA